MIPRGRSCTIYGRILSIWLAIIFVSANHIRSNNQLVHIVCDVSFTKTTMPHNHIFDITHLLFETYSLEVTHFWNVNNLSPKIFNVLLGLFLITWLCVSPSPEPLWPLTPPPCWPECLSQVSLITIRGQYFNFRGMLCHCRTSLNNMHVSRMFHSQWCTPPQHTEYLVLLSCTVCVGIQSCLLAMYRRSGNFTVRINLHFKFSLKIFCHLPVLQCIVCIPIFYIPCTNENILTAKISRSTVVQYL